MKKFLIPVVLVVLTAAGTAFGNDIQLYHQYQNGLKKSTANVQQSMQSIQQLQLRQRQWEAHRYKWQNYPQEVNKANHYIRQCQQGIYQQNNNIARQRQWQQQAQNYINHLAQRNPQIRQMEARKWNSPLQRRNSKTGDTPQPQKEIVIQKPKPAYECREPSDATPNAYTSVGDALDDLEKACIY